MWSASLCRQRAASGTPDSGADVGHERPRRRRPHEQVGPGDRVGSVGDREAHVHRGVDHVAVPLRHLVRGERGAAAGAVGDHAMALMRLFWTSPDGGTYVAYPLQAMLAACPVEPA